MLTELYVLLNYWGVVLCTLNPSVSLLREVTVSLKPILYVPYLFIEHSQQDQEAMLNI